MQDALLRERYPGGLRSRLAEPLGPGPRAGRGAERDAALGDAAAEGAVQDGACMEAATTGAGAAGSGEPVAVPGALPKPMGITESGSLREAAPGRCPDEADAPGGPPPGPLRPSPAACDAPYDAALLHLARAGGGEVPDQALGAARTAAAARDWPAGAAVLGRLPALRPLAVALAWDDLGPGRQGEGDPAGDQAGGAADNAQERGARHGEQGSPDERGLLRGGAGSFGARRELLARLPGSRVAPPAAGPIAAALQRLHAQLHWRLDLAERVGAEDAHAPAKGRAAPAAPAEGSQGSPAGVSREPKHTDAPPRAGAKGVPKGAPGAPEPQGTSKAPPGGAAPEGAFGAAGARGWEGRAAAVLKELAAGRSALRVLRSAPRRPDERSLLAAVAGQSEMVSGERWLCATCSPCAIALMT